MLSSKRKKSRKQQLSLSEDSESVNKEAIIENLADQLTEKLFGFIVGLGTKFTNTIIKDQFLIKYFKVNIKMKTTTTIKTN